MDVYEDILLKYVRRCERLRTLTQMSAPDILIEKEMELIKEIAEEFVKYGYLVPSLNSSAYKIGLIKFKEMQFLSQVAVAAKLVGKHRYKYLVAITDDNGMTDSIFATDNNDQAMKMVDKFTDRGYEAIIWPDDGSAMYNAMLVDYYEQEEI